ncbi:MAG TPA: hypothetical protein VH678_02050 [Xanthobacteraceae bacterium]|jgi:hypothetical protein
MTIGSLFTLLVTTMSFAALGSTAAEAEDFAYADFLQSQLASMRPKLESHARKHSFRIPKGDIVTAQTSGSASPASTEITRTTSPSSKKGCLKKEYLATGAVLFKDKCTNEWAINSSAATAHKPVRRQSCLSKELSNDGVVVFRDSCTNEWAMNTSHHTADPAR